MSRTNSVNYSNMILVPLSRIVRDLPTLSSHGILSISRAVDWYLNALAVLFLGGLPGMGHVASGRGDGASVSSVGSSCSPPQSEEFSDASQERGGRVSRRLGGTPGSDIVSPSTPTGAPIPRRRISSGWCTTLTVCPLYNVGTNGWSLAPVLHLSILVHRLYIQYPMVYMSNSWHGHPLFNFIYG